MKPLVLLAVLTTTVAAANEPKISGEIKARREIKGIEYAIVSVGAVDGVKKGMKLRVVDKEGKLLAHLIVDSAEQNESVGHLEGAEVRQVQKGTAVSN